MRPLNILKLMLFETIHIYSSQIVQPKGWNIDSYAN